VSVLLGVVVDVWYRTLCASGFGKRGQQTRHVSLQIYCSKRGARILTPRKIYLNI